MVARSLKEYKDSGIGWLTAYLARISNKCISFFSLYKLKHGLYVNRSFLLIAKNRVIANTFIRQMEGVLLQMYTKRVFSYASAP